MREHKTTSRCHTILATVTCTLLALAVLVSWASAADTQRKAKGKAVRGERPAREWTSGIAWPEPKQVRPGNDGGPPSDAIVLLGGTDMSAFDRGEKWVIKKGYAVATCPVETKQAFGDCQLHIEWATPAKEEGDGQQRGNNGIKLMGLYEIQILESSGNKTYADGQAAAVYKQHPPLVNASRRPGRWQMYDIIFKAPRFDSAGGLASPAVITVLHNGVLVHNHFEIQGTTSYVEAPKYEDHERKLPLLLAYHGSPIRFRNIWIRPLEL